MFFSGKKLLFDVTFSIQHPGYDGVDYAEYRIEGNTLYEQSGGLKFVYEYKFTKNTLIIELIESDGLFCGTGLMHLGIYKKVK
ncbi:hypothetical protein D0T87_14980 [Bacteroides sp. 51]|nr:hypothetical protein [Bacteroides sp. 51]